MNTCVTGNTIKTLRELNHLTQGAMADRIGISSKACNRKRTQDWKKELPDLRPFIFI